MNNSALRVNPDVFHVSSIITGVLKVVKKDILRKRKLSTNG
jgi:hypothetical protein